MKDPDCCVENFVRALGAKSRCFPPSSLGAYARAWKIRSPYNPRTDNRE
jgi:hypothetical protein